MTRVRGVMRQRAARHRQSQVRVISLKGKQISFPAILFVFTLSEVQTGVFQLVELYARD